MHESQLERGRIHSADSNVSSRLPRDEPATAHGVLEHAGDGGGKDCRGLWTKRSHRSTAARISSLWALELSGALAGHVRSGPRKAAPSQGHPVSSRSPPSKPSALRRGQTPALDIALLPVPDTRSMLNRTLPPASVSIVSAAPAEPKAGTTIHHSHPVPHTTFSSGAVNSIAHAGWTITTKKHPIFNSAEIDNASKEIQMPFPEMFFGNNAIELKHSSGFQYSISALDALRNVASIPESEHKSVQVAHAEHWTKMSLEANDQIKDVVKPYNWIYLSSYSGTLSSSLGAKFEPSLVGVDLDRLRLPEPILFYDELVLYEDELHDNGISCMTARIRVMPSCFLVLLRFFLRVDNVTFRINETRIYHEFGKSILVREYTSRAATYSEVTKKLPRSYPPGSENRLLLLDQNWVSQTLGSCSHVVCEAIAVSE
ncbi:TIP41-like family-domain-containing protein [Polychytrium aggregatum]|uniref:TIP41-like family-domain-containing protein n=1 Tax=Polychytrium aggregatum TaxID=110093 RepID=UPI0022FE8D09|nr:TIP41-like family-domain-containing protein [Polychytrium aggregatum]KAI9208573.1 TIP41-like family-domain-containing protein [Polychytrium aggregatum]